MEKKQQTCPPIVKIHCVWGKIIWLLLYRKQKDGVLGPRIYCTFIRDLLPVEEDKKILSLKHWVNVATAEHTQHGDENGQETPLWQVTKFKISEWI